MLLVIFQIAVTLSSIGLAGSDTTIVYNIATNNQFAQATDYISLNPNNFLLVIWFKLNYLISHENIILLLAIWNIIFIDFSILLLFSTSVLFGEKINSKLCFCD
ncbi:membrane protein [Streptococcus parauberis]|nr:membrane protein [Streptococcus parauberis]